MSLQGSIHTWYDGNGFGAFIPTDRAYYNVRTPRASGRRPSSEQLREYRRNNVTGGIDTHRSDISFGKTTESVRGGREGDPRAREATKSLTSGEVGGFVWPAERARDGDVETILASSSAAPSVVASSLSSGGGSNHAPPSMMLEPRSVKQKEKTAEAQVISSRERQRRSPQQEQEQHEQEQLRGEGLNILSARCRASTSSSHSGGSTQRSDSTCAPSSSSSTGSYSSSRQSSFRSTASSFSEHQNRGRRGNSNRSSTSSSSRSRRRTQRPTSYESTNRFATLTTVAEQHLSHRSSKSSARENRLRPPILRAHGTPPTSSSAPSATRLPRVHALDPVFDRHHKYDLIAEERAAQGGEVTGRFGKVQGSSVLAASLLTSELSTPWSHVLRGQKW